MRLDLAVVALALPLGACAANFEETTLVRVRSPERVAVSMDTPGGRERVLEAGDAKSVAELPPTRPPFTELVKYVRLEREPGGAIASSCPSCGFANDAPVVDVVGNIALAGRASETVAWRPDAVAMRWSHDALFRCRRFHGECPREAYVLTLDTPPENVLEIRERRIVATAHGERTGATIGVLVGATFAALGAAIAIGVSIDQREVSAVGCGLGGAFMAGGLFFLFTGLRGLGAKDEETVVFRR
ncbi:MAG TPA: hypothetical protein VIF62_39560 [Labilithrix sp.]|jgi:hypothetical protein